MSILLLVSTTVMLSAIYLRLRPRFRTSGPFLPDALLIGLMLYATGAVVLSFDDTYVAADVLAIMSLTALVAALCGAIFYVWLSGPEFSRPEIVARIESFHPGPLERTFIFVILLMSVAVCALFIYMVMSSSTIGALLSVASLVADSSLLEARKAITSGTDGYFAPGYVKQFRDILIPVLLIACMAMSSTYRRRPIVWLSFSAAIVAMAVSGQRQVLVVFFLVLLMGSYLVNRTHSESASRSTAKSGSILLGLAAILLVYGFFSVWLGRVVDDSSGDGLVVGVVGNLFDRIFLAAPRENLATMPYWLALGPTFGQSWLSDLAGILPGVDQAFSNVLHARTGGSIQGNSPLGFAPDTWLAWGWGGLIVIPFLFAVAIGAIDSALSNSRSPALFGAHCYLFTILPVCYSPYLFILYGGAATAILFAAIAMIRSRRFWRFDQSVAAA